MAAGSHWQAPWRHCPFELQHSRFVSLLQMAPPHRLQRRRAFLPRAAASSERTDNAALPERAAPKTVSVRRREMPEASRRVRFSNRRSSMESLLVPLTM